MRIPKALDFDGDEVVFRKERDGKLSLEPVPRRRSPKDLIDWLKSQPPLDEDFAEIEDYPPEPVDIDVPQ